jgi:hypothetical protein
MPTQEAYVPDSPDGHSELAGEVAFLAAHAVDPARHGLVIDETRGRPEMYVFDAAQPIVTGRPASQLGHRGRADRTGRRRPGPACASGAGSAPPATRTGPRAGPG